MSSFPSQQSFSATNQSDEDVWGRLSTWHWVAFYTSVNSVASPTLPVVLFPWCLCLLVLFVSLFFEPLWLRIHALPGCSFTDGRGFAHPAQCKMICAEITTLNVDLTMLNLPWRAARLWHGGKGMFACARNGAAQSHTRLLSGANSWCRRGQLHLTAGDTFEKKENKHVDAPARAKKLIKVTVTVGK